MSKQELDRQLRRAIDTMERSQERLEALSAKDALDTDEQRDWNEATAAFDQADADRSRLERELDLDRVREAARDRRALLPGSRQADEDATDDVFADPRSVESFRTKANPWALEDVRVLGRTAEQVGDELRSRAVIAIEKMPGTTDRRRETMTALLERWDTRDGALARQLLATSSPEYLRAFAKVFVGKLERLTPEEARAMSLTDSAGGYLVPFQLDPTVILTSDGSLNEIRQVARQVVATGDIWHGVSAGETSWSWDAETVEASDDTSTFAQPTVPVHKAVGFVPISIEALQDEANVTNEVARLLAEGKDTLESVAFATGSGTGQPTGIVTALTGTSSVVASTTTDVFAAEDVYKVQAALPARYRSRASWLADNAIYNEIRQFASTDGPDLWERIGADRPALLLGRNAYEAEAMDGVINLTADNYVLIFGAFSNFVIADRIGMTVELIPHLFATANNRPSGQRGWFAYYRTGSDSVNDGGFRMLNVT